MSSLQCIRGQDCMRQINPNGFQSLCCSMYVYDFVAIKLFDLTWLDIYTHSFVYFWWYDITYIHSRYFCLTLSEAGWTVFHLKYISPLRLLWLHELVTNNVLFIIDNEIQDDCEAWPVILSTWEVKIKWNKLKINYRKPILHCIRLNIHGPKYHKESYSQIRINPTCYPSWNGN